VRDFPTSPSWNLPPSPLRTQKEAPSSPSAKFPPFLPNSRNREINASDFSNSPYFRHQLFTSLPQCRNLFPPFFFGLAFDVKREKNPHLNGPDSYVPPCKRGIPLVSSLANENPLLSLSFVLRKLAPRCGWPSPLFFREPRVLFPSVRAKRKSHCRCPRRFHIFSRSLLHVISWQDFSLSPQKTSPPFRVFF